jgi:hypothetical protein
MVAANSDMTKIAVTALGKDLKPYLRIYCIDGSVAESGLGTLDQDIVLNPTGLSFSPDGSRVAVAFEQRGEMSIVTGMASGDGTASLAFVGIESVALGIMPPDASNPDSAPPQNQLVWLAGGDYWLYGRTMILDGSTQRKKGTLYLEQQILQQTIVDGRQLFALVSTEHGKAMIRATIDTSALAGTAPPATTKP